MFRFVLIAQLWLAAVCLPSLAHAQFPGPIPQDEMPRQVISTNPVGLVLDLVNAEYEVRTSDYVTVGAGASRLAWGSAYTRDNAYLNGDAFVRYHPGGTAFNGAAYGLKVGYTDLPGDGTYLGVGFDINHNTMWNRHFYSSTGIGMKRLIRGGHEGVRVIPTVRLNFGVAF